MRIEETNYKLWLNGNPHDLWIMLGLGFFFIASKNFESLIFVFGIMLRQEVSLWSKKILFLIVVAFFIRSLYENTTTSDVMAPVEPKRYSNLREMVLVKVKVLVHQTFLWDRSFEDKAEADFRKGGLEYQIHNSSK